MARTEQDPPKKTTKVVEEESDATAAAGPHRPEPARQVFHNPGSAPTVAKAARTARGLGPKVRATQDGYYGEARRRTGDVFTLLDAKDFSHKWMETVDGSTPEKVTTGRDVIRQQHDEIVGARLRGETDAGRAGHPEDDDPPSQRDPLRAGE